MKQGIVILLLFGNSAFFGLKAQADTLSIEMLDSLYYTAFDKMSSDPATAYQISKDYFKYYTRHFKEDSLAVAYAYDLFAQASYYYGNRIDSAIALQKKANHYFESLGESFNLSSGLSMLTSMYTYKGNYRAALSSTRESYKIDTAENFAGAELFYYLSIADLLLEQEEYQQAELYLDKGLIEQKKDTVYPHMITSYFSSYAWLRFKQGKYNNARDTVLLALAIARGDSDFYQTSYCYSIITDIELAQKNFDKAAKYINKQVEIDRYLEDPFGLAYTLEQKARLKSGLNQNDSASLFIDSAVAIASGLDNIPLDKVIYKTASDIYAKMPEKALIALETFKIYEAAKDSLNQMNVAEKLLELRNTANELELALLEGNKVNQEKELRRKNAFLLYTVISLMLGIIFIFILIQNRKQIKRNSMLLEAQNQDIDAKREKLRIQSEELNQKNKELEKLNKSKNRLLSVLAHDVRAPFNQLYSILDLLKADAINPQDRKELVESLAEGVHQTKETINNLLIWSKTQFAGAKSWSEVLNLSSVVKRQILQLSYALKQKNIQIEIKLEENTKIFFDASHLEIILRNLLQNAIKFSEKGGKIKVFAEDLESSVKLSIQDFGVGISPTQIQQILGANQHDSTKGTQNEEGTGLGLLIVKELLEENNARLTISSEINKGSIFSLLLPLP